MSGDGPEVQPAVAARLCWAAAGLLLKQAGFLGVRVGMGG